MIQVPESSSLLEVIGKARRLRMSRQESGPDKRWSCRGGYSERENERQKKEDEDEMKPGTRPWRCASTVTYPFPLAPGREIRTH